MVRDDLIDRMTESGFQMGTGDDNRKIDSVVTLQNVDQWRQQPVFRSCAGDHGNLAGTHCASLGLDGSVINRFAKSVETLRSMRSQA